jgi:adenylyltransferase/sulfurtransferase
MSEAHKGTLKISTLEQDPFDRQKYIPGWDQSTLEMGKVLIVGAGALGNEVSKNLAQCGVGDIAIIDSDQVELTNLNRCVYFRRSDIGSQKATTLGSRIREYFPDTTVTEICGRFEDVDDVVLKNIDLVVSCVDNMDTRLTINRWCSELRTPLVDGGTDGLYGRVQTIFPPDSTCLDCAWRETHRSLLQERHRCGQKSSWFEQPDLAVSTATSAVAACQSMEAIKVLRLTHSESQIDLDDWVPDTLINKLWLLDFHTNQVQVLQNARDPECPYHDDSPRPCEPDMGESETSGG